MLTDNYQYFLYKILQADHLVTLFFLLLSILICIKMVLASMTAGDDENAIVINVR